jgi:hypothetical protein
MGNRTAALCLVESVSRGRTQSVQCPVEGWACDMTKSRLALKKGKTRKRRISKIMGGRGGRGEEERGKQEEEEQLGRERTTSTRRTLYGFPLYIP